MSHVPANPQLASAKWPAVIGLGVSVAAAIIMLLLGRRRRPKPPRSIETLDVL